MRASQSLFTLALTAGLALNAFAQNSYRVFLAYGDDRTVALAKNSSLSGPGYNAAAAIGSEIPVDAASGLPVIRIPQPGQNFTVMYGLEYDNTNTASSTGFIYGFVGIDRCTVSNVAFADQTTFDAKTVDKKLNLGGSTALFSLRNWTAFQDSLGNILQLGYSGVQLPVRRSGPLVTPSQGTGGLQFGAGFQPNANEVVISPTAKFPVVGVTLKNQAVAVGSGYGITTGQQGITLNTDPSSSVNVGTNWFGEPFGGTNLRPATTPKYGVYAFNGGSSTTIDGRLTLGGVTDLTPVVGQLVTVKFYDASNNVVDTQTGPIDIDGYFSVTTTLSGNYRVTAKISHWLAANLGANAGQYTLGAGLFSNQKATLINGDVDGNNAVNIVDYAFLSDAFNTVKDGPGFDPRADLDENGAVNIVDYAILSDNFNLAGV